jgi:hypothetical protein
LTRSQLTALGRRINFAKSVLYMASALQDGPMAGKVRFPTFRFSRVFFNPDSKMTHKIVTKRRLAVVGILAVAPF